MKAALFLILGLLISGQGLFASSPSANAATCQGETATIVGDGGDNNLIGGQGHNVIAALGGADYIDGRGDHDTNCGNEGMDFDGETDSTNVNDSFDWINMGSDCDFVYTAYRGDDLIHGGSHSDGLYFGGCGQSQGLHGGLRDDTIFGDDGDDELVGGSGTNDWADGGNGEDTCDGATTETILNCEHII